MAATAMVLRLFPALAPTAFGGMHLHLAFFMMAAAGAFTLTTSIVHMIVVMHDRVCY